ncbi:hypothetical protein ACRAWF_38910 [Streptomyces sp. L7]
MAYCERRSCPGSSALDWSPSTSWVVHRDGAMSSQSPTWVNVTIF